MFLRPIFFAILLYLNYSFAGADEATLIESVCSTTPQPWYCRQCMSSLPFIKKDKIRDLAAVTIDCAINQAYVVQKILDHYSKSTNIPEIVQCGSIYSNLQDTLRQASHSWVGYQYAKASSFVDSAKCAHWTCYNLLVRAKRNIPVDLANAFIAFVAYDDVAKNVLSQIK